MGPGRGKFRELLQHGHWELGVGNWDAGSMSWMQGLRGVLYYSICLAC